MQHGWATAVETVDAFTNENLKFGAGSDDWTRFFQLVSQRWQRIFRQKVRLLCYTIRVIVAAPDADAGSMPAPTGGG
jgi:hypothetical protein